MKAFLNAILPRMLPSGCAFNIYAHEGKEDLMHKLGERLRDYAAWLKKEKSCRIVIIVDRDNDDCKELKRELEDICEQAGLRSRSDAGNPDWQVVTRIAVEELEAWYFGDWQAVCAAYPRVPANIPGKRGYRDPDAIKGGTWEAFRLIMRKKGYFRGRLHKVEAAQQIGRHIDPQRNQSPSFKVFWNAVTEAVEAS